MPPNSKAAYHSASSDSPPTPPVVYRAEIFAGDNAVCHGFTGGFCAADEYTHAVALWRGLKRGWGRKVPPPLLMAQPHGAAIADADALAGRRRTVDVLVAPGVDGVESAAGTALLLVVKSADCVPVLAVNYDLGRCAVLHAGWRGVAAGILPALLERWRARGSRLETVRLAFGPHIRSCCFQVQQDCVQRFNPPDLNGAMETRSGSRYIALETVLRTQASRFGIVPEQIETLPLCTDCTRGPDGAPLFASYRRANRMGAPVGRNLSFITLLPHLPSRQ